MVRISNNVVFSYLWDNVYSFIFLYQSICNNLPLADLLSPSLLYFAIYSEELSSMIYMIYISIYQLIKLMNETKTSIAPNSSEGRAHY